MVSTWVGSSITQITCFSIESSNNLDCSSPKFNGTALVHSIQNQATEGSTVKVN